MKIISWKIGLPLLVVLFFLNITAYSQVIVERSDNKVIISGITYYLHYVKKGETAYSISRAYGISVEDLTRENPTAVYGVNERQILRIPARLVTDVVPARPTMGIIDRNEDLYIYHQLKPGETVYSLSKFYGVSEDEIITSNPGIEINKLSIGAEIAVPRREFMSTRQKFDEQENKYLYHKVLKGESLSSIASMYGLTLREIRRENRGLRFPQVGDYVKVPNYEVSESFEIISDIPDTLIVPVEDTLSIAVKPSEYIPLGHLSGALNVAVLLPFYLKENSVRTEIDSSKFIGDKRQYKVIKKPEDWIYPRSFDFIEMYEGILLAADTLRSLGLDINIYPYDIKSDTIEVTRLIQSGELAKMDLIIGPVYSYNLSSVAAYARILEIPVVSPVPLINNLVLNDNPTLFMANSSIEIAQKALSSKTSEYYYDNFVFIHSDTARSDNDVRRFRNMILYNLSNKMPYEEIRFKEFPFYSRSMFDNDSINRLSHALSEKTGNIIILASEETPVLSETIQDIHGLSKKFDIKVFGYPALRNLENLDPKYFFDLDIMVYSDTWIDYSKKDIQQFISDFRRKFLTEPIPRSFAWQGYDIMYYFTSGISKYGKEFINQPWIHYPDLLQTEFDFRRKEPGGGFENNKLFLIRFTKDYNITLEDDHRLLQQY